MYSLGMTRFDSTAFSTLPGKHRDACFGHIYILIADNSIKLGSTYEPAKRIPTQQFLSSPGMMPERVAGALISKPIMNYRAVEAWIHWQADCVGEILKRKAPAPRDIYCLDLTQAFSDAVECTEEGDCVQFIHCLRRIRTEAFRHRRCIFSMRGLGKPKGKMLLTGISLRIPSTSISRLALLQS